MMKNVFFLFAMVACFFAGCSEGDEPVAPNQKPEVNTPAITLDSSIQTSGLSFDTSTSEKSITFTSATDWTLSIAETRSGTSWCTASPTSGGKGTATVKFTTTENTEPEDRSVAVTIKAGATSKTFTVTQKGNKSLLVTTKKYELPKEGGEIEIEVKANVEYEMEISETAKDWISENTGRAITTHKHLFNVTPSEEATKREGEIIFKSGDIVEIVKVYQAGEPTIVLSKNEFTVSDAGETISIDIKSNVEFDVQMPDVDWITEEPASRAMSSHTLKYIVSPNETYEERSAKLIFCDKNCELKDTLTIIQVQKDALFLSQKKITAKRGGETIEIILLTNVNVEVSMPETDWVKQVESRGLKEKSLYFEIAENKTNESRSVDITITDKENAISDTFTIIQGEGIEMFTITNTQAGGLKGINLKEFQGLKLIGNLNGTDVSVLRKLSNLKILDLSEAKIVEGGEYYYAFNDEKFYTENNVIGSYFLNGFGGSSSIEEIILPTEIIDIKENAFSSCRKLITINLSDKLESIGVRAFAECTELKEINLPNSLKNIDRNAFVGCTSLIKIKIPHGINIIESGAFGSCYKLVSVDIPNTVTDIKENAFAACTNLRSIEIPNSVKTIEKWAFFACEVLTTISLSSSVSSIHEDAFYNCSNLSSIIVDINNPFYDSRENCNAIIMKSTNTLVLGCKNTKIPQGVTKIGVGAFNGCKDLVQIEIPNSVVAIEENAFSYCENLARVTSYNENPFVIGNDVFSSKGNAILYVPKGAVSKYKKTDGWAGFKAILEIGQSETDIPQANYELQTLTIKEAGSLINENIEHFRNIKLIGDLNGTDIFVLRNWKGESLDLSEAKIVAGGDAYYNTTGKAYYTEENVLGYKFFSNTLNKIILPNNIISIDGAFIGCTKLTELIIPESVEFIGKSSFSNCTKLQKIIIPNSVTFISASAFSGCSGLSEIALPNRMVSSIEDHTFYDCSSLKNIKLPEGITAIGTSAFRDCTSLISINIPNSVTKINYSAFANCENLTSVYCYLQTPIVIDNYTFSNSKNCTLYIPKGTKDNYKYATGWSEFKEIIEMAE